LQATKLGFHSLTLDNSLLGKHAATGIAVGTITPMVPIFVMMFWKKDFGNAVRIE